MAAMLMCNGRQSRSTALNCSLVIILLTCLMLSGCGRLNTNSSEQEPTPASSGDASAPSDGPRFVMGLPEPGTVEQVVVKASGRGRTSAGAVNDAIRRAVTQVNGVDMAGETSQGPTYELDAAYARSGRNTDSLNIRATSFHDNVVTSFGGRVSGFEVLTERQTAGEVEIEIQASVPRFKPPTSTRTKVVVAAPRSAESEFVLDGRRVPATRVVETVRTRVIQALAASGRVDVLERSFDHEITAELSRITSGQTNRESRVRLGQQLTADFVWVATLERFEVTRTSQELRIGGGRRLESISGAARMSHRLVNVATGQVIFAANVDAIGPSVAPTTLGASLSIERAVDGMTEQLASEASRQVVTRLFPVVVLNRLGDTVVLSHGTSALRNGQAYRVSVLSEELVDPQTGDSLGFMEQDGGTVLVTRVSERVSYGTLLTPGAVPATFRLGQLQLRERVPNPSSATTSGEAKPASGSKPKPAAGAPDDDVSFEFGSKGKKGIGITGGRGGGGGR